MKFVLLFAVLALVLLNVQAQRRCRGTPSGRQVCHGPRNEGATVGGDCARYAMNVMWWYNPANNTCNRMRFHGCGGNNNRYCSHEDCMRQCRRRT